LYRDLLKRRRAYILQVKSELKDTLAYSSYIDALNIVGYQTIPCGYHRASITLKKRQWNQIDKHSGS